MHVRPMSMALDTKTSPWEGRNALTFTASSYDGGGRHAARIGSGPSEAITATRGDAIEAARRIAAEQTVRGFAPALAILQARDGMFHVASLVYTGTYEGRKTTMPVQMERPYGATGIDVALRELVAIVDRNGERWSRA